MPMSGTVGGATLDAGGRVDVFEAEVGTGSAPHTRGGRAGRRTRRCRRARPRWQARGRDRDRRLKRPRWRRQHGTDSLRAASRGGHHREETPLGPPLAWLSPSGRPRLQRCKACHGGCMDPTLAAGRAKHLLGLQNRQPDSPRVDATDLPRSRGDRPRIHQARQDPPTGRTEPRSGLTCRGRSRTSRPCRSPASGRHGRGRRSRCVFGWAIAFDYCSTTCRRVRCCRVEGDHRPSTIAKEGSAVVAPSPSLSRSRQPHPHRHRAAHRVSHVPGTPGSAGRGREWSYPLLWVGGRAAHRQLVRREA